MLMLRISVSVGLAMAGRLARRPGLDAKLERFHEASTLIALGLIAGHAGLLMFDGYLRPGPRDHASVRNVLSATVHGHRDHRRLACGDPRPQLLRAQVDRRKDVADDASLPIVVYLLALVHVVGAGPTVTAGGCSGC